MTAVVVVIALEGIQVVATHRREAEALGQLAPPRAVVAAASATVIAAAPGERQKDKWPPAPHIQNLLLNMGSLLYYSKADRLLNDCGKKALPGAGPTGVNIHRSTAQTNWLTVSGFYSNIKLFCDREGPQCQLTLNFQTKYA